MAEIPPRDPRVVDAVFDVWTNRQMIFNNPSKRGGQNLKTYQPLTKAKKVKYTGVILKYLDSMEKKSDMGFERGRAVAIELDGIVRYVWRDDLYTKAELDESQRSKKAGLRALCSKSKGDVD